MTERKIDELKKLMDQKVKSGLIIDPAKFSTPDMGDLYFDEVDLKHIKEVSDSLENNNETTTEQAPNDIGALFYLEDPYSTELGFSSDGNVFIVKVDPILTKEHLDMNKMDGDTFHFKLSSIRDGGNGFKINNTPYNSVEEYMKIHGKITTSKDNTIGVRLIGIDAPETPKYRKVDYTKDMEIKTIKGAEIKNLNPEIYMFRKGALYKDNEDVVFLKPDKKKNVYCQISSGKKPTLGEKIIIVNSDKTPMGDNEYYKQGMQAKEELRRLLADSEDMRLILDAKSINKTSGVGREDENFIDKIFNDLINAQPDKDAGYNAFGMDKYKRFLGALYVKMPSNASYKGEWINAAKYIATKTDKSVLQPSYTDDPYENANNQFTSDAFKVWTYDLKNQNLLDAMNINQEDLDDRKKIQQNIMGRSFEALREHTVMIGDCLLMVPPTSIRVVTQTTHERAPLLRAKGSMTKSAERADRILEMTVYFNDEKGINGVPYIKEMPGFVEDEQGIARPIENTYYMNGLRALIAMFKFTPYLPIENDYINDILNIDAVSLVNIQVTTTEGFPQLLTAVITLQEFDYRIYMPELPVPDPDKGEAMNKNMFAATINFQAMRFYYQSCIRRGELIKNIPFNSNSYLKNTLGSKTALQPMSFTDSKVEFYVVDKEYLDRKMQIKLETDSKPVNQLNPVTKDSKEYIKNYLIPTMKSINDIVNNPNPNMILELDNVNPKQVYFKWVNDRHAIINKYLGNLTGSSEIKTEKKISGIRNDSVLTIEHKVKLRLDNSGIQDSQLESLLENTAKELGLKANTFESKTIHIILTSTYDKGVDKQNGNTELSISDNVKKLIALMAKMDEAGFTENSAEIIDSERESIKNNTTTETSESLRFNKLPIENIKIKTLAASFGNSFSNMNLQLSDGFAPQYAGGQETAIEIQIETTDKNAVLLLNQLPKISSMYTRHYREILTVWPLRINSEITRLMGVNEVVVENVDISTSPSFPGLYTINMKLIGVDRTLRNREQIDKIDKEENYGNKKDGGKTEIALKDFFDLKDSLSDAEVYPDLELPSILELERFGFKFIKYSKNSKRKYPDPDFYFYYGHILGHEIFRNAITSFINDGVEEPTFEISDMFGSSVNIKLNKTSDTGYDVVNKSEEAQKESNNYNNNKKASQELNKYNEFSKESIYDHNDRLNNHKEIITKSLFDSEIFDRWDVSDTIKCHFREKRYDQVYEEYGDESFFIRQINKKNKEIIDEIDSLLAEPIGNEIYKSTDVNLVCRAAISNFYMGRGKKLLNLLSNDTEIDYSTLSSIIAAAGCARTGDIEFSGNKDNESWKPDIGKEGVISYCKTSGGPQGTTSAANAISIDDAIANGVTFGPFAIKRYSIQEFERITGEVSDKIEGTFIDPYYRDKPKEYITKLMNGINFSALAINREALYWLKKMAEANMLVTISDFIADDAIDKIKKLTDEQLRYTIHNWQDNYDGIAYSDPILTPKKAEELQDEPDEESDNDSEDDGLSESEKEAKRLEKEKAKKEKEQKKLKDKADKELAEKKRLEEEAEKKKIKDEEARMRATTKMAIDMMKKNKKPLAIGKVFTGIMLAATSGDKDMIDMIIGREYNQLNALTEQVKADRVGNEDFTEFDKSFRRFIRGLAGYGVIKSNDKIGSNGDNPATKIEQAAVSRIYLEAAENPMLYLSHSFYDMIVNDKRGRMLRAFPTYYMMFVDEGREIGYWKLNDNFYNMNSISQFQVVKSRKIAADTANITISNMFKTFDGDDTNLKENEEYDWKNAFKSIFSPRSYAMEQQVKRLNESPIKNAILKPGIRLNLRMGYGANAASLPTIFNGVIAEVNSGESVDIIAQGDGIELAKPIVDSIDAEDVSHQDSFYISKFAKNVLIQGATPRNILCNYLTSKGGFIKKIINKIDKNATYNENSYGIYHFGDMDFKEIFKEGEVVQNIYEAISTPSWGKKADSGMLELYADEDSPQISIDTFGKSYWDIMSICESASVDFIASVVPFQMRSSVFYGAPRYYYAFDYIKSDKGNILEKRKPFQQHHIYTSYSDIISNNIIASDKDVNTCAVGTYETRVFLNNKTRTISPLWVDFDIYPEKQKTMTVDTRLLSKGIGSIYGIKKHADEKGIITSGDKMAWRMTANALKNSVKEMYKGDIVVIGDPSIKPHDRIWIEDVYERMNGSMGVEAVIHSFNIEEGFTTTIYPDCIATVDDRHEKITQTFVGSTLAKSLAAYGVIVGGSLSYAKNSKPLLTALSNYAGGASVSTVNKVINPLLKLIGKDNITAEKYVSKIANVQSNLGFKNGGLGFESLMSSLDGFSKSLGSMPDIKDISGLAKYYSKLGQSISSVNNTLALSEIDAAIDIAKKSNDTAKLKALNTARTELVSYGTKVDNIILASSKIGKAELKTISDIVELSIKNTDDIKKIDNLKDILKNINNMDKVKNVDDINMIAKALKSSSGSIEGISGVDDLLKHSKDMYNAIGSSDEIAKGAKALASSSSLKGLPSLLSKAGVALAPAIIISMALEMAITYAITKSANEFIERKMKNLQVLQVFPIKKNGVALTAGLNGSKGLIVGSPSGEQEGVIEKFLVDVFDPESTRFGGVVKVLSQVFGTDSMREIALNYKRRNGSNETGEIGYIDSMLENVVADEMKKQNSYHGSLLTPRITQVTESNNQLSQEAVPFYNKTAVEEIKDIELNKKITNYMIPINSYVGFKNFFDKAQMVIGHNSSKYSIKKTFTFNGKKVPLECIERNGSLDIPILYPDALYLLNEIMKEIKKVFEPIGYQDSLFDKHKVIIQSALVAGKKSMAATGLVFIINVVGFNGIEDILNTIIQKEEETFKKLSYGNMKYFSYQQINSDTYRISVYPEK